LFTLWAERPDGTEWPGCLAVVPRQWDGRHSHNVFRTARGGGWQKIGKVSCTECTGQRNDFKLIPTAKMETRNPGEGLIVNFRRSVIIAVLIIAVLWRPKVVRSFVIAGRVPAYSGFQR